MSQTANGLFAPVLPTVGPVAMPIPDPTRRLTWLYASALTLIGCLAVFCQILIQPALRAQKEQIPVVNIAGA